MWSKYWTAKRTFGMIKSVFYLNAPDPTHPTILTQTVRISVSQSNKKASSIKKLIFNLSTIQNGPAF